MLNASGTAMLNDVFIRVFPVQMCSMAFALLEFQFYLLLLDMCFSAPSEFQQEHENNIKI